MVVGLAEITAGDIFTGVLLQLGGGGILGFAAGYALKKAIKILLLVVGVFTLGLMGLAYYGVISVNWDKLALLVERAISGGGAAAASLKSYIIAATPFAASFLVGFSLGFKYG
ncbi:conserved hypothetical protein [Aeropyrum pernix]|uniref:FUN14 family protein n=1 Tax=Aeropyrum pernix TaxID=56636 RepID=A0A401H9P3_AERPX|nr:conserved hypothetical protein [Aeropyrum pernix]